jgi:hypothetical protein
VNMNRLHGLFLVVGCPNERCLLGLL